MSNKIDSLESSLFQNDLGNEAASYSDLQSSNRMILTDSLPSLTMASSQESSDSNEATMEWSLPTEGTLESESVEPLGEGDVEAATVPPPMRDAPPSPQRMPRMIVDVDAYMDDDEDDDDVEDTADEEVLCAKAGVISSRTHNDEDFFEKTVVISNVSQSSPIPVDAEVPSPTASPKRSSSQKAAVNAVLGYDVDEDYDDDLYMKTQLANDYGSADRTAELSDDELAAAIPPNLRRHASHRNSTPGAFLVHGSGLLSLAPTAAMTCDTDVEDPMGSPPTLIAATLVDPMASYSSVDGVDKYHEESTTLVFAEPLWWKRRLVLCISGWMLLALGVITLSATLAVLWAKNHSTDGSPSNEATTNASDPIAVTPTMSTVVVKPTSAPTWSPVVTRVAPTWSPVTLAPNTYAPNSAVAFHAVSWGMVSTCEEGNSAFYSNDLSIHCGGGLLEIHNISTGVACESTLDDVGSQYMACQLNETTEGWDAVRGVNTKQASGLVLFSCRSTLKQERVATVVLPEVPVALNCSTATSDPLASNFVSLGRFCFEDESSWKLRQQIYQCENSLRGVIPQRKRRNLDLFDIGRYVINIFGLTSFCYNTFGCSGNDCIVPQTAMSDVDSSCVVSGEVLLPTIDDFWADTQAALQPSKRIDSLISGPVRGR
jgi:hypothetical protein